MSKVLFISDLHIGHKKIIKWRDPGRFQTVDEHDEYIIDCWNAYVHKRDTVWILGDVCFGKNNLEKLNQMNGYKRLVMGNHDQYPIGEYAKYFGSIHGCAEYKGFILTHIPVDLMQESRYKGNIHGHTHGYNLPFKFYHNVCVEQVDYTPISLDELLETKSD